METQNNVLTSLVTGIIIVLSSCGPKQKAGHVSAVPEVVPSVTTAPFGTMKDGHAVTLYTLKNKSGASLSVMNYGGIITSLNMPDRNGTQEDVVLGFDSLSQYEKGSPYFGALIGRYGNRLAKGKFTLDGKEYAVPVNDGANALHGGVKGFDKVFWTVSIASEAENPSVKLHYVSKDGEEGYPGNLTTDVSYTLTEDNELKIAYTAATDKKTVLNITQHTYFNLSGNTKKDILGHELTLAADRFLPIDKGLIPTGELKPVAKTPFDFTAANIIGSRINENDPQLKAGIGYDHCWILTDKSEGLNKGGTVYDPASGRQMEFYTTEPAVQFYSGNFLDGKLIGKYGVAYKHRFGLCLETEHYPDSPNHKSFPTTVIEPGQTWTSATSYKFSVR